MIECWVGLVQRWLSLCADILLLLLLSAPAAAVAASPGGPSQKSGGRSGIRHVLVLPMHRLVARCLDRGGRPAANGRLRLSKAEECKKE